MKGTYTHNKQKEPKKKCNNQIVFFFFRCVNATRKYINSYIILKSSSVVQDQIIQNIHLQAKNKN